MAQLPKRGNYVDPGPRGAERVQSADHVPHHIPGSTAQLNPVPKDPPNPPVTKIDRPGSSSS